MTNLNLAIQNMEEARAYNPTDYDAFLKHLDNVDTEEKLFSNLTFYLCFQGDTEAQRMKFDAVKQRANELKLWAGLDLKLERWKRKVLEAYSGNKDAFMAAVISEYEAAECAAEPQAQQGGEQLKMYTLAELEAMTFAPERWIVDNFIPMGLGLLVAKQKVGKSWFTLDLCLAVAEGGRFLGEKGFIANKHGTLYIDLEETPAYFRRRERRVLGTRRCPEGFRVIFDAPRMGEGLLEKLGATLDDNPDIHLVCIDILALIRPAAKPFQNAYEADYAYMHELKRFVDKRGICVLLIHHTNKAVSSDVIDTVNGSNGLSGAADFTMTLTKTNRMDNEAKLSVIGRNVQAQEYELAFDTDTLRWNMTGTAREAEQQRKIAEYEASPIVKTIRGICQTGSGKWKGNSRALFKMGEQFAPGEELAPTGQKLASALKELSPLLYERDAIRYQQFAQNGARMHVFSKNGIDERVTVIH